MNVYEKYNLSKDIIFHFIGDGNYFMLVVGLDKLSFKEIEEIFLDYLEFHKYHDRILYRLDKTSHSGERRLYHKYIRVVEGYFTGNIDIEEVIEEIKSIHYNIRSANPEDRCVMDRYYELTKMKDIFIKLRHYYWQMYYSI